MSPSSNSAITTFNYGHLLIFVPESEHRTRTYILLFGRAKYPLFKLLGSSYLKFGKVVVEQDAAILGKRYADTPKKLNSIMK